jgi:branched-chain amino acid transport system substrate-binding protein
MGTSSRARSTPEPTEPLLATVDGDGSVEQVDGALGARLLSESPQLVSLATGFLSGPELDLAFYWQASTSTWFHVTFQRERSADGREFADVSMSQEPLPFSLTAREIDVLTLVAGGLANNEIADEMMTSPRTVGSHVEHLLRKTGLPNRAALTALAVRSGIIRLPSPGRTRNSAGTGLHPAAVLQPAPVRPTPPRLRRERRPIIVGSAVPLQGLGSADGHEMRNGAGLAIAEINARGGISGRPIRQIVIDVDISDPASIHKSFSELIDSEVDAITSGYFFVDDEARHLAVEYGAPYLHAMTSEASVGEMLELYGGSAPVFQVCPSEDAYGLGFIRFLDELEASGQWRPPNRQVAFVETAVPGGQMANLATFRSAEQSGWSVSRTDLMPSVDADWQPIIDEIRRTNPAAVMVAHFVPGEIAAFQRLFAQEPSETLVYAIYTPSIPEFLSLAGPTAEGLIWSTVSGTYGDRLGVGFSGRYQTVYGRPPGRSHAGIAYDGIHLLAQAWSRVENPRAFPDVARQLRASTYRGVNGAYFLDNAGQSGLSYPDGTLDPSLGQAHLVFQIQGGAHRILSPDPYVESTFRLPPWVPRTNAEVR